METHDRTAATQKISTLASITVVLCSVTLFTASISDGWAECSCYFWPSHRVFGKDPGPFGWERLKRDFPWNPQQRPWVTANIIAILGICSAFAASGGRPKWWYLGAMSIIFIVYSIGGFWVRWRLSTTPEDLIRSLIWDFASFLNINFSGVTVWAASKGAR